jgi:hypothetical protein
VSKVVAYVRSVQSKFYESICTAGLSDQNFSR